MQLIIAFIFGTVTGYSLLINTLEIPGKLPINSESVSVCFSPNNNCQEHIIKIVNKAQYQILVQAYSFTSSEIGEALIKARERGVDIKVLLDKSHLKEKKSLSPILINNGIDVKIDRVNGIAHNKIMIVDESIVITGSYNFTKAANNRNTENLLIISDPGLASLYLENWRKREQNAIEVTSLMSAHKSSK